MIGLYKRTLQYLHTLLYTTTHAAYVALLQELDQCETFSLLINSVYVSAFQSHAG